MAQNNTMEINLWNKKDSIFEGMLDPIYQTVDYCDVYYIDGKGFVILNHEPKYPLYARMGIPEIQDIFVLPNYRGQGVATALIRHCEAMTNTDMIGISVPVSPQFGAAQCLYAKLGYRPDGQGVTYDRQHVYHNSSVQVDENLCLMLLKDLK